MEIKRSEGGGEGGGGAECVSSPEVVCVKSNDDDALQGRRLSGLPTLRCRNEENGRKWKVGGRI